MKRLPFLALLIGIVAIISSCNKSDTTWDDYADWRNINNSWLAEQGLKKASDGTPYYDTIRPTYDPGNYVLAHWFNDRSKTAGNLVPYSTSTVSVKYIGKLYNEVAFDSSYRNTDSIFITKVNAVIAGWTSVLQQMHVGDTIEVVIPYQSAYGATGSGIIKPYSTLVFGIKLVDIPAYEIKY